MDRGNYEGTYAQAEVTGEGPFDYREMGARKDSALSGIDKNACYPNVSDINLGVMPGEPLVYRKGIKTETRSGGQRLHVFSSFNGAWFGRYKTPENYRRKLGYAGCSKTQINYGDAPGGARQSQTGLAWIKTGETAFNQNTGNEVIVAGDLVYLDLPSFSRVDWPLSGTGSKFVSPNNPSGGTPNGKFLMVTRPFKPTDFRGPLETYSAMLNFNKTADAIGGIKNVSFADFKKQLPEFPHTELSCAQQGASALLFAIFGIYLNVHRTLKNSAAADAIQQDTSEVVKQLEDLGLFTQNRNPVLQECVNACLLENAFSQGDRTKVLTDLEGMAPDKSTSAIASLMKNGSAATGPEMAKLMCHDALQDLLGANAEMAHEQNRWILGRAEKNSAPGQKLVVNVGAFTRPSSY